jgi:hypothetical protein
VTKEPGWDSPRTRALAAKACFDYHSNLTRWPWYSKIAPESWLIQRDVDSGRSTLNFSAWDKPQEADVGEIVEAVNGGGMPPWYYRLLHSKSRLSKAEKAELIAGLQRTLQANPSVAGGGQRPVGPSPSLEDGSGPGASIVDQHGLEGEHRPEGDYHGLDNSQPR